MATLIKTDGTRTEVQPKNKRKGWSLKELQGFVGGYIEIQPLGERDVLVLNEEGKLEGLPLNREATRLWVSHYGQTDYIVGDVLVCLSGEVK